MRMRRKGAEFEALGLLRTFVGGPAAAQWAMAGGAPAPQLNDRSRPRPQRGNGRERLPPLAAHRHMRPLHVLEPCRAAEAGARVQASIEGFEPAFSTCSDARSSTTCCRRLAARRSTLIDGRRTARAQESTHAGRGEGFHQAWTMQINTAVGPARPGSTALIRGMAPTANSFEWNWAAHRQLKSRWSQAKRRGHISRRLAVSMRRGSAAVLAHSLDMGGRPR